MLVVLGSRREAEGHRPSVLIDQCGELGVESTLGPSHRLGALAPCGIGSVLMQLDVRAIQVTQLATGPFSQRPRRQLNRLQRHTRMFLREPSQCGRKIIQPQRAVMPQTKSSRLPPDFIRQLPRSFQQRLRADQQPVAFGRQFGACIGPAME